MTGILSVRAVGAITSEHKPLVRHTYCVTRCHWSQEAETEPQRHHNGNHQGILHLPLPRVRISERVQFSVHFCSHKMFATACYMQFPNQKNALGDCNNMPLTTWCQWPVVSVTERKSGPVKPEGKYKMSHFQVFCRSCVFSIQVSYCDWKLLNSTSRQL